MYGLIFQICLCALLFEQIRAGIIIDDYEFKRNALRESEMIHSLGGRQELNEDEIVANDILMDLKEKELEHWFHNPRHFNFSKSYFTYKDEIKKSQVYQIIKRMPKGGALHVHSTLMVAADYMLELTYEDHLYVCYTDDNLSFLFSESTPERPCPVEWALISDLRKAAADVKSFDLKLKKYFTLHTDEETAWSSDINTIWARFDKVYLAIKQLTMYRPVREKFMYEALKRFYDDNVLYIEIRSGIHNLYELNGTVHDKIYMVRLYNEITNKFIAEHPDFIGVKLIVSRFRKVSVEDLKVLLDLARQIKHEMPDFFAGFDLVGQEEKGIPLKAFVPLLLEAKKDMDFFFHAGETNWFGTPIDENLIDAILLGSKRIGHAYALTKHPTLMAAVFEKDIAIEVNVISNQVLSLVKDVRNHPLATYLALGLPVVLSSDDPGVWGADPLSHDFYIAFVAIAHRQAGLRLLKKLALNSIMYSALNDIQKARFYSVFNTKWDSFVKDMVASDTTLKIRRD